MEILAPRFTSLDGGDFVTRAPKGDFDLIFADAWPGKFSHLDEALALLRVGGLYVIDDLLPQANWPDGHAAKVPALVETLESKQGFRSVKLAWASGLMLVVRTADVEPRLPHPMFTLDQVVPWGRSFDEYGRMFGLSDEDLAVASLAVATARRASTRKPRAAARRSCRATRCTAGMTDEIRGRIAATYDQVMDQTRQNAHEFVWGGTIELGRIGTRADARDGAVPR